NKIKRQRCKVHSVYKDRNNIYTRYCRNLSSVSAIKKADTILNVKLVCRNRSSGFVTQREQSEYQKSTWQWRRSLVKSQALGSFLTVENTDMLWVALLLGCLGAVTLQSSFG
uniref:Uncharacterized protein n=1 Tax=Ciona intestinalis TaxID=7719 RepID=H2Y1J0_CIOIN